MSDDTSEQDRRLAAKAGAQGISDRQILQVLERLQASLDRHELPEGFSPQGLERLLESQAEFLEDLGNDAIRLARRVGNNEVQPVNVDRAEEGLRAGSSVGHRSLETFGAVIFGLAGGIFVQEITADAPRMELVALTVGGLVVAALMLMYGLAAARKGG